MCLEYQLSANVERLAHGVNDWSEPLPERTLSRLPLSFLIFLLPGKPLQCLPGLQEPSGLRLQFFISATGFPLGQ